jgi:hypothetical protein
MSLKPAPFSRRFLSAALLLVGSFVFIGCREQRIEIPRNLPYGWIVIDTGREGCLASERGDATFVVPPSRYVCTSSPLYTGLAHRTYALVDSSGQVASLRQGEWIHREERIQGSASAFGICDYDASAFFYGPKGTVTGSPLEVLANNRADCRAGYAARRTDR